ncbi:MAG: hypothetical protein ACJAYF_000986 [Arenicella sp.]|jgi:hypothetical protein
MQFVIAENVKATTGITSISLIQNLNFTNLNKLQFITLFIKLLITSK